MVPIVSLQPITWKGSLILVHKKQWQDPLAKCIKWNIFHGYKLVYSLWQISCPQETVIKRETALFQPCAVTSFFLPCVVRFSSNNGDSHGSHFRPSSSWQRSRMSLGFLIITQLSLRVSLKTTVLIAICISYGCNRQVLLKRTLTDVLLFAGDVIPEV